MTPSRNTSALTSPNEWQPRGDAKTLTVGISSTALFDLSVSNAIYQKEGLEAYRRYQISQEDTSLEPGGGFYLVEKLLNDCHYVYPCLIEAGIRDMLHICAINEKGKEKYKM